MEIAGLDFKRIRLSEKATQRCRSFKAKTGLTPNIACRLALAVSINETNTPSLELFCDDSGQEINRYTFLGDLELPLLSLFILWCEENGVEKERYFSYLMAHINRGIELLTNRVKGLEDLINLINTGES